MNHAAERWKHVHELFDPAHPAADELRVPRSYNPLADVIGPRLRLPLPHQKYVLAGGVGSGKSTELRATAGGPSSGKLVVLVDLWQHFERTVVDTGAIEHLQPAELVGLLGLAILRVGAEVLGHDWRGLDDRLAAAITAIQEEAAAGPTVDVARLSRGLALVVGGAIGAAIGGPSAVALKVLEAAVEATSWEWKVGRRDRPRGSDQDAPVRAVLAATNALLDDLRGHYAGREVVILLDGTDRVTVPSTFEALFVESSLLGDLRCDLVVTLRLGLVQRYGARLHRFDVFEFTGVPVADRVAPERPHPPGLAFFRALAHQRLAKVSGAPLLGDALLDRLAYASGGRLRDFVALVREVAVQAMLTGAPEATPSHVDAAIDLLRRRRESGINTAELELLSGVLADPERALPAGEVAQALLDRQLLLTYPNESTWYLPHPILLPRLRGRTGPPASA